MAAKLASCWFAELSISSMAEAMTSDAAKTRFLPSKRAKNHRSCWKTLGLFLRWSCAFVLTFAAVVSKGLRIASLSLDSLRWVYPHTLTGPLGTRLAELVRPCIFVPTHQISTAASLSAAAASLSGRVSWRSRVPFLSCSVVQFPFVQSGRASCHPFLYFWASANQQEQLLFHAFLASRDSFPTISFAFRAKVFL